MENNKKVRIKSATIVKQLNEYCSENGLYDRADKINWLMKNYPNIFTTAQKADQWLNDLWMSR